MLTNELAPYDILIVDDSNAILSHVLNTLNSPHFRCRVARTAQSGLEQIRTRLPDLLLLDCQLDGSHKGAEVLAGCPSPHAPVTIVFSASAEEADTMFHRFEQVSSRILKPFSNEELRTHVREALEENADTILAIRRAIESAELGEVPAAPVAPEVVAEVQPVAVPPPRSPAPVAAPGIAAEDPLLRAFLGVPALQRELSAALRGLVGSNAALLASGPAGLLPPASALTWALHQPRPLALTLRHAGEVIEVYLARQQVQGVASDAWAGTARGLVRPPATDPEGLLQHDALLRLLAPREEALVELRELAVLPSWTCQQPAAALARLACWNAGE